MPRPTPRRKAPRPTREPAADADAAGPDSGPRPAGGSTRASRAPARRRRPCSPPCWCSPRSSSAERTRPASHPPPFARIPGGGDLRRRPAAGPAARARRVAAVIAGVCLGLRDHPEAPRHGFLLGARPAVRPRAGLDPVRRRGVVPPGLGRPGRRDRRRHRGRRPGSRRARPHDAGGRPAEPSRRPSTAPSRPVPSWWPGPSGSTCVRARAADRRRRRSPPDHGRPRPRTAGTQVRAGLEDERAFAEEAAVDTFARHPGRPAADRAARQGRHLRLHRELRPQRHRGPGDGTARSTRCSPTAPSRLEGGRILRPERLPHLADVGRRQLAGALHLHVGPVDQEPAALPQRHLERPADPHRRLPAADAWRTVGIMPGVTRAWPEGKFYGHDNVYDTQRPRLQGPEVQLVARTRPVQPGGLRAPGARQAGPRAADVPRSSWSPATTLGAASPRSIGWDEVGDGSVYDAIEKEGKDSGGGVEGPRPGAHRVPALHRVLGDTASSPTWRSTATRTSCSSSSATTSPRRSSPARTPAGTCRSRSSPTTRRCCDRISGWGWQDGLKPGPSAPVWRMDTFRDRFLAAYSSRPGRSGDPPAR